MHFLGRLNPHFRSRQLRTCRRIRPGQLSANCRSYSGLHLLPRLAALVAPIGSTKPLAGERTIRVDIHHQDRGSALGQRGDRQDVADDFADADLLAIVPFQLESAGRCQGDVDTMPGPT